MTSSSLALEIHIRMTHAEMSCQSIVPAESLLLSAEMTSHLLLACIVDSVFMPREVVRSAEDGIAGLAGRGVDSFTFCSNISI